jgi:Putative Tad-like Flp pilus-assembly
MRMKSRRGAFVVLTGVMFLVLIGISAVAIDFSRLWTLKNELQTSADAGAMGGAIQLSGSRIAANAPDSARAYALTNTAMLRTVVVDSLILGNWNPNTRVFTVAGTPTDAITVVVGNSMRGLIMGAFGISSPRLKARAIGWAGAPVAGAGCMKPWVIPYETLMYTLNVYRGIANPGSNANLNRTFDQTNDIAALTAMNSSQRTFTLKLGGGGAVTAPVGGYTGSNMPGNYQAVELPKLWDYLSHSYTSPSPPNGANAYRANIDGTNCYSLSVGDSLATEPGNMVGPTLQGIEPAVCNTIVNSGANTGDCLDSSGNVGVTIKSGFFACGTSCNGRSTVEVKLLGSFVLTKVYPHNYGTHDKAEIMGIFNPIQSGGAAGGSSTLLQKPLLVR